MNARCLLAGAALLGLLTAPARGQEVVRSSEHMVEAAEAFIAMLDGAQRGQALFAFEDEERFNWHYVPRRRAGLPLKGMTPAQREAALALLRVPLSDAGYAKATGIVELEGILREVEGGNPRRDKDMYHLSIFGTPSAEAPWGWRFEGHHLSLNFSSATGALVAATPAFMGTNPARVPGGEREGWRVLADEEDRGRALVQALSPKQQRRALLSEEAPSDIITGADRRAALDRFEGLPASAMDASQRTLLDQLLATYTGNLAPDLAARYRARLEAIPPDSLFFAWAGSLEPGEGHYYRLHTPTFLIEYDNTQNRANHVHTVWRDLEGDFGEDLLREHYEAQH